MPYEGYLNLGGNEVANTARAFGYTSTGDCPVHWLRCDCDTLADALGDDEYTRATIAAAPWYDPDIPELSSRFLGASVVSVVGLDDSTRSASITQKTTDGGQISGYRHGTRAVRVRVFLTGEGEDGLDYGMAWLRAALEPNACGVHSLACGTTSLEFLAACPPERDGRTDDEYEDEVVGPLRRYLHGVVATSGPLVQEVRKSRDGKHHGAIVEFTLEAEEAFIYSKTRTVTLPPTVPSIVEDVPFNLVRYPSAELAGDPLTVATNFSTNPSLETNDTGWSSVNAAVSGTNPSTYITAARSNDIAAVGTWSYRCRLTGSSGASGSATMTARHVVNVTTRTPNARLSIHVWGALISTGTGGTLTSLTAQVEWLDGSNAVLGTASIPAASGDFSGRVFQARSLLPPPGTSSARVSVTAAFDWGATSIISLYADAVAVTEP